jgi:hypothetical protein
MDAAAAHAPAESLDPRRDPHTVDGLRVRRGIDTANLVPGPAQQLLPAAGHTVGTDDDLDQFGGSGCGPGLAVSRAELLPQGPSLAEVSLLGEQQHLDRVVRRQRRVPNRLLVLLVAGVDQAAFRQCVQHTRQRARIDAAAGDQFVRGQCRAVDERQVCRFTPAVDSKNLEHRVTSSSLVPTRLAR